MRSRTGSGPSSCPTWKNQLSPVPVEDRVVDAERVLAGQRPRRGRPSGTRRRLSELARRCPRGRRGSSRRSAAEAWARRPPQAPGRARRETTLAPGRRSRSRSQAAGPYPAGRRLLARSCAAVRASTASLPRSAGRARRLRSRRLTLRRRYLRRHGTPLSQHPARRGSRRRPGTEVAELETWDVQLVRSRNRGPSAEASVCHHKRGAPRDRVSAASLQRAGIERDHSSRMTAAGSARCTPRA